MSAGIVIAYLIGYLVGWLSTRQKISELRKKNEALASTTLSDGMYYELTYNGDKDELYFDAYKKWENICIPKPAEKI